MPQPIFALGTSLFAAEPDVQWRLPKRLREVSGLAVTPDGRIMGHDDEMGVVYEIDVDAGAVVKRFSLGPKPIRGDFEGLAIDPDGVFYMTTSLGQIYRFREGEDRGHVPFEVFDTGLNPHAEIEGLAFHVGDREVILAAKKHYGAEQERTFGLYSWSPAKPRSPAKAWLTLPLDPLAEVVRSRTFRPSSLEIDPLTGRLIVLAARQNALVEMTREGEVTAARALGRRHRQAEGSAVLPDGALVIADEGGDAKATITRYARRHD